VNNNSLLSKVKYKKKTIAMDICRKYVELHDKIKHIRIAMLTLEEDEKGGLRSVPMVTMQTECEGNIWFFTSLDSEKVDQIQRNPNVNLTYADQRGKQYVSITGKAEIIKDENKMKELWKPNMEEYFPGGLNSPDLGLVKVKMEHADFWNENNTTEIWDTSDAVKVENSTWDYEL
jgi:general stress protein 26